MGQPSQLRSHSEATKFMSMAMSVCIAFAGRSPTRSAPTTTAWLSAVPHTIVTTRCHGRSRAFGATEAARRHHEYRNAISNLEQHQLYSSSAKAALRYLRFGRGPARGLGGYVSMSARGGTDSEQNEARLPFGTAYHVPVVCREVGM